MVRNYSQLVHSLDGVNALDRLARSFKFWRHEPEELYPLFDLPVQSVRVQSTHSATDGSNESEDEEDLAASLVRIEWASTRVTNGLGCRPCSNRHSMTSESHGGEGEAI